MSVMNGNDTTVTNGQPPAIVVKDTKVISSSEFNGVITRAKDG